MSTTIQNILTFYNLGDSYTKIETLANTVLVFEDTVLKIFSNTKDWQQAHNNYAALKKHSVPHPEIIASDSTPKPHILMEKISGQEIKTSPTATTYFNFGVWVGKLHSITFDTFGAVGESKIVTHKNYGGPYINWKEMHLQIIQQRVAYLKNTIFEKYINATLNYFKKYDYPNFTPCFVHEDLNLKNVFVEDEHISGVVDFDDGYAGCYEEELMRIEQAHFTSQPKLREQFLKGYQTTKTLLKGYEQRRELFELSRLLVEIRCLVQFPNYKKDSKKEEMKKVESRVKQVLHKKEIDINNFP